MGQPQIRIKIGAELRKAREVKNLSLDQVIAKLSLAGVRCSKSNLSRIELNKTPCRTDIFAGLALLYNLNFESILYKSKKY